MDKRDLIRCDVKIGRDTIADILKTPPEALQGFENKYQSMLLV